MTHATSTASSSSRINLDISIAFYLVGFLIMTLGIAVSVKSDLGVSPVSSIPYTITCITGLDLGLATIVFHVALVVLQIVLQLGLNTNDLKLVSALIVAVFLSATRWSVPKRGKGGSHAGDTTGV